jgi:hypothetical protein
VDQQERRARQEPRRAHQIGERRIHTLIVVHQPSVDGRRLEEFFGLLYRGWLVWHESYFRSWSFSKSSGTALSNSKAVN